MTVNDSLYSQKLAGLLFTVYNLLDFYPFCTEEVTIGKHN